MPDSKEDKAVRDMEEDVRAMAARIRPQVGSVTPFEGPPPMPRTDDRVTVTHLHAALDQLTQAAGERADEAWAQAQKLTGAEDKGEPQKVEGALAKGPVFEGLARQITDVGRQLARLKRAQEAIGRAIS
jgi:hypothetical protein